MNSSATEARRSITEELRTFLHDARIRSVHFAQTGVEPPPLAYVTGFPRLSVILGGKQWMEIAVGEQLERLRLVRGQVVFVDRNCWNKPDWSTPAEVMTVLFGKKQVGLSLVSHDGKCAEPMTALKTTISPHDVLTQNLLEALTVIAPQRDTQPLDHMLAGALLHACLRQLERPATTHSRKAVHLFETICLYLQENFQSPLSRESVAQNFGLTPNHISRLFRREGSIGFNDYLTLVRMDRAKFMLRYYDSPLKKVAASCGYHDVAYFCRVFRLHAKVTPTEYRLAAP